MRVGLIVKFCEIESTFIAICFNSKIEGLINSQYISDLPRETLEHRNIHNPRTNSSRTTGVTHRSLHQSTDPTSVAFNNLPQASISLQWKAASKTPSPPNTGATSSQPETSSPLAQTRLNLLHSVQKWFSTSLTMDWTLVISHDTPLLFRI